MVTDFSEARFAIGTLAPIERARREDMRSAIEQLLKIIDGQDSM